MLKQRLATAALSALMLASPLAAGAAYADPPSRHDNDRGRDNDRNDRRDNDRRDNDRNWRDNDRRDHDRRGDRWDNRRFNGYTYNGRWYYGPPQSAHMSRAQYGYHAWRRGDRLPSYYRTQYRQVDYRRAHLRAPPRGYHYVRSDRGETLLVGIATGVILSVILAN